MTQNARLRGTQPAAVIAIIVRKFVLIARATSVGPVLSIGCNRQNDIGQFPLPRRVVLFRFRQTLPEHILVCDIPEYKLNLTPRLWAVRHCQHLEPEYCPNNRDVSGKHLMFFG